MKKTLKVILIGDPGSGKTSILARILGKEDIKDIKKTKGVAIESKTDDGLELVFWDFSGQVHFRDIVVPFFSGANIVIAVFDLSNPETLYSLLNEWKNYVVQQAKEVPVIVVGNKKDRKSISDEAIKGALNELKKEINIVDYIETSAKTKENIDKLYERILQLAYELVHSLVNKP